MAPTELAIGDKVTVAVGEYQGQAGTIVKIQSMDISRGQPEALLLNMGNGREYWIASVHITFNVRPD